MEKQQILFNAVKKHELLLDIVGRIFGRPVGRIIHFLSSWWMVDDGWWIYHIDGG
jgi:hypothetical protein